MVMVNLGWIFFRANSMPQAREMLTSVFSPATYGGHILSKSLYLLVLAVGLGYAVVLIIGDTLDRQSPTAAHDQASDIATPSGFTATIAHWRWFWLAPLYAVALLFLLIVTLSHGTSTAQLMYGNF
jgi:hypothetical protein